MSDLTEALKQSIYPPGVKSAPGKAEADWVDAMHRVHRAARLVADGKVIPVEDIDYEAAAKQLLSLLHEVPQDEIDMFWLLDLEQDVRDEWMVWAVGIVDAALHLPEREVAE